MDIGMEACKHDDIPYPCCIFDAAGYVHHLNGNSHIQSLEFTLKTKDI